MSAPSPLVPEQPSRTGRDRHRTSRQANSWDAEYGKDVWRLRELGITDRRLARIVFVDIPLPWLKALAKRWARWRLATGLGVVSVSSGTRAITSFGQFLADAAPSVQRLADLDRELLERYLAHLYARFSGTVKHRMLIGQLNLFFTTIRQHGWDDSLPSTVMFFSEDFPKEAIRQPRALSETVMAQLENPDNLAKWNNPSYELITLILMGCGLRITDTVRLPTDSRSGRRLVRPCSSRESPTTTTAASRSVTGSTVRRCTVGSSAATSVTSMASPFAWSRTASDTPWAPG